MAAVRILSGPAQQEVTRMLQARNQLLDEGETRLKERRKKLTMAEKKTEEAVRLLLNQGSPL